MPTRTVLANDIKQSFRVHLNRPIVGIDAPEEQAVLSGDGVDLTVEPADAPENLLDEIVEEGCVLVENMCQIYGGESVPFLATRSYLDGILAVGEKTYTDMEDVYAADRSNAGFAANDAAVDEYARAAAEQFDSGLFDEAGKGYMRFVRSRMLEEGGASVPAEEDPSWQLQGRGYVFGLSWASDEGWMAIARNSDNAVLFTDEESIDEYSSRQASKVMKEKGADGLLGQLSQMLGVEQGEMEAALGSFDGDVVDVEPGESGGDAG